MQNGRAKTVPPRARTNTQDVSDVELVEAATEGHEWAWNLLVDRFAPSVWSVARAGELSDNEAAEIFRLTWMRTADRLSAVSPDSIGRWLQDTAERERARITALQAVGAKT
jgi:hypothetical protein